MGLKAKILDNLSGKLRNKLPRCGEKAFVFSTGRLAPGF